MNTSVITAILAVCILVGLIRSIIDRKKDRFIISLSTLIWFSVAWGLWILGTKLITVQNFENGHFTTDPTTTFFGALFVVVGAIFGILGAVSLIGSTFLNKRLVSLNSLDW